MLNTDLLKQNPQELASNPNINVYLSANAGTGKTKVLVDRYINLLLAGANPRNILCITFTKNAAQEIVERIVAEVSKIKDAEPTIYHRFLDNLQFLKIQTLHSFCHDVLTEYTEADISIITEEKLYNLFEEAWQLVSEELTRNMQEELAVLLAYLTPQGIKDKIHECYCKLKISAVDLYDVDFPPKYDFDAEVASLVSGTTLSEKKSAEIIIYLLTQKNEKRKKLPDASHYYLQDQLIELLDKYKEYQSELFNCIMRRIVKMQLEVMSRLKNKKGVVEFSDLLTNVNNIIMDDPEVLYKLNYRIDHILVDEAQDLSEEQWQLIDLLSEEFFSGEDFRLQNRTIFIVGDFKQSIYGFQGARPDIFLAIKERYAQKVRAAQKEWVELDLYVSYRSHANVLQFIDDVFCDKYANWVRHVSYKGEGGIVASWSSDSFEEEKTEGWRLPSKEHRIATRNDHLACDLAQNIAKLAERIPLSDIMIIFRKRSEFATAVISELNVRGLPCDDLSHNYMQENLVYLDLISIIKFVLFPDDDLNLAGLLKSPCFNYTDEMIVKLAANPGNILLAKLKAFSQSDYDALMRMENLLTTKSKNYGFLEIIHQYMDSFIDSYGSSVVEDINYFTSYLYDYFQTENACWVSFLNHTKDAKTPKRFDKRNAVKVMTAHGSKGLQARVVVLADAFKSVRSVDSVIVGEGVYFIPPSAIRSNVYHDLIDIQKHSLRAEEKLLLYVALSRAESELYIYMGDEYDNHSWAQYVEGVPMNAAPYSAKAASDLGLDDVHYLKHKYGVHPESNVVYSKTDFIDFHIIYGKLIHELLYYKSILCDLDYESYKHSLYELRNGFFSRDDIDAAIQEAQSVIDKYPELFAENTLSELPILFEGSDLRIDKLVMREHEIRPLEIIDFKTDRTPKKTIPTDYQEQLARYKMALSSIYPDYKIETKILWTQNATISDACAL